MTAEPCKIQAIHRLNPDCIGQKTDDTRYHSRTIHFNSREIALFRDLNPPGVVVFPVYILPPPGSMHQQRCIVMLPGHGLDHFFLNLLQNNKITQYVLLAFRLDEIIYGVISSDSEKSRFSRRWDSPPSNDRSKSK